ncbi:MAG: hypothetical protein QOE61_5421 [Micromonosporaceae bacterium]|nr:hypothetical protein [Micromonosporaceae bacterium]
MFISSGVARRPVAGWAVYGATKLAGESFFEALAAQHAGDPRFRVVNVNPGTLDTDMQGRIREHARREVYFPDRERFLGLYERGELAAPTATASGSWPSIWVSRAPDRAYLRVSWGLGWQGDAVPRESV